MNPDPGEIKEFIWTLNDLMDPFNHPMEGWTRARVREIRDYFLALEKETNTDANT